MIETCIFFLFRIPSDGFTYMSPFCDSSSSFKKYVTDAFECADVSHSCASAKIEISNSSKCAACKKPFCA